MNEDTNNFGNTALPVGFVQSDYFLARVREFEHKYRQSWFEFFAAYSHVDTDQDNLDFEEWAFLCEQFFGQLIEMDEGPPGPLESAPLQKPEADSGFRFLWRPACSTLRATSRLCRECLSDVQHSQ